MNRGLYSSEQEGRVRAGCPSSCGRCSSRTRAAWLVELLGAEAQDSRADTTWINTNLRGRLFQPWNATLYVSIHGPLFHLQESFAGARPSLCSHLLQPDHQACNEWQNEMSAPKTRWRWGWVRTLLRENMHLTQGAHLVLSFVKLKVRMRRQWSRNMGQYRSCTGKVGPTFSVHPVGTSVC